jgi:small nuclear ribonucleoprotein (snRNP)-like protein
VVAVEGVLKGYDQLLNLVMDETVEYLRGDRLPHHGCCRCGDRRMCLYPLPEAVVEPAAWGCVMQTAKFVCIRLATLTMISMKVS